MPNLIVGAGEAVTVQAGGKVIIEDGGLIDVLPVSWAVGQEKGGIILRGGPGIYIPANAGQIFGAVNNINSGYPDWSMQSRRADPAVQPNDHCLTIAQSDGNTGSTGIGIEKRGARAGGGGYGIAIRVYGGDPGNEEAQAGLGIDCFNDHEAPLAWRSFHSSAIRIRKDNLQTGAGNMIMLHARSLCRPLFFRVTEEAGGAVFAIEHNRPGVATWKWRIAPNAHYLLHRGDILSARFRFDSGHLDVDGTVTANAW